MSDTAATTPSTRRVARTRGAASGVLLVLLGAWAALAPFIGPLFSFGFTPDTSWHWTAARGWYEVAPGGVTVLGGLLLLAGTSRVVIGTGAWLGILAGGWLVVGPAVSTEATLGSLGTPLGDNGGIRALERLAFFYLLGAVIIFLASAAFGRLSVVTVRDARHAEQREAARLEAEQAEERERLEREALEREVQERRNAERQAYERQTAERESAEREAAYREASDRQSTDSRAADSRATDGPGYEQPGHQQSGYQQSGYSQGDAEGRPVQRPAGQARPYDDQQPQQDQQYGQQPYGEQPDPQQPDQQPNQPYGRPDWPAPPPQQR